MVGGGEGQKNAKQGQWVRLRVRQHLRYVNQKNSLCGGNRQLPPCLELVELRTPTKRHRVRVGWMPQELNLFTSLVTQRDDPEPPDGAAVGTGSGAGTLSSRTRQVYAGAWQAFLAWHSSQGDWLDLPVPPERLVAYIESLPPLLGPNGVRLRLAAVAEHHERQGLASPTAYAAVRAALRRRQMVGEAVLAQLTRCGEDLAGLRNRALLLLVQVRGLLPGSTGMTCASGMGSWSCQCGQGQRRLGS